MNINLPGLADSDGVVFKTIPAGQYPVRIVEVEIKDPSPTAKFQDAQIMHIKTKVSAGHEHADTVLFIPLQLPSPSMDATQAQRAIAKVKRLCIACGISVTDDFDSQDLMGEECIVVVSEVAKKGDTSGAKVNQVDDYLKIG